MKKDREWLKEEIEEDIKSWGGGNPDYFRGASDAYENVKDWLNQLDEPETLSEYWIERNTSPVDDEGRLYVWKSDLQNLLVPKQELPVIPKFVANWIEASRDAMYHLLGAVYDGAYSEDMKEWLFKGDKRTRQDNQDKLARAWLHGYTVEKEQKYQVIIRDGEYMRLYLCKHDGNVTIGTNGNYIEKRPEVTYLTEQEIKDYDERYWPFAVKVEELEE